MTTPTLAQSLSPAQELAVSEARRVCAATGYPLDQEATVRILPPDQRWPDAIALDFILPNVSGDLAAYVNQQTGRVVALIDLRTMPGGDAVINEKQAIALGTGYLEVLGGLPGPAVFKGATLDRIHPEIAIWSMRWSRQIGPYECADDGAGVIIAADTGRLVSMSIGWQFQAPESLVPAITRDQAIELARAYAATDAAVHDTYLRIVRRPQGMDDGLAAPDANRRLTLAWIISFEDAATTSVVIDAATGALVDIARAGGRPAGGAAGARGVGATIGAQVQRIFRSATEVELIERDTARGTSRVLVTLRRHDDPALVIRLAALVGPDCTANIQRPARYELRVNTGDGRTVSFDYWPQIRLIASADAQNRVSARVTADFDRLLRRDGPRSSSCGPRVTRP